MKEEKLVSVLVPAYNHQDYIRDCLESVVRQSYKNLEILVQDDCSTDNTASEIKKIKDKRIKAIFSKKNQGVVSTLNDLMKMAKGDYIAVIGSDDIWKSDKIEKQVQIFRKNPKLGGVFSTVEVIDEKGDIYDDEEFPVSIFSGENMTSAKRLRRFFESGNHLCHSSSILTREAVEKIGFYNKAYRQLHDYDYWVRLVQEFEIYVVDKPLVKYRRARKINNSVSCFSRENEIRTLNELYNVNALMITNMEKQLLANGFSDKFLDKKAKGDIEIICEKFFLLLNMGYNNSIDRSYALNLIYNSRDNERIFKTLEDKYGYKLNDFYDDVGKDERVYPCKFDSRFEDCNKRIDELEKQNYNLSSIIREMRDSRSWRCTAPVRKITTKIRGGKK